MRERSSTLDSFCKTFCRLLGLAVVIGAQPNLTVGALAGPGDRPLSVVELYTSQGCSSCPPADALLQAYAERKDVLALTLPVDYWDYLGWKDTLASPKHSARQRAYAKERGDGRIYTPQVIVNGLAHVPGTSASEIDRAISETVKIVEATRVPVTLKVDGSRLGIEVGHIPGLLLGNDATIWLAVFQPTIEVPVRTGENRGKTLTYFNVVRELTPVGMWNGQSARFELARESVKGPDERGCAVLVQTRTGGAIIGAAAMASC